MAVALCSAIVLWGNIPLRLAKAEEQIDDLKNWAKELQGYTRAQQEYNQRQQQATERRVWDEGTQCYWCCAEFCEDEDAWHRCP